MHMYIISKKYVVIAVGLKGKWVASLVSVSVILMHDSMPLAVVPTYIRTYVDKDFEAETVEMPK